MIHYAATGLLLGGGAYLLMLKAGSRLWPAKWRSNDNVAVAGRVMVFLGVLMLPTCFGFSLSEVRSWLEDIWTSGGGAGTG